jgi:hypothetical protein
MPRFYLHIRRGREVEADREGVEFPTLAIAEREAVKALAGAWRKMPSNMDPTRYTLEVADEEGRPVLAIPFPNALGLKRSH